MGIGGDLAGGLEELLTVRTLRDGGLFRMTGTASQCWRAEKDIEHMYEGMRCLLLPSATAGLMLLLELLDLEPGREVLIAPFGWISNWSCIRRAGLVPRFLPLDSRLQLRAADVAARLSPRTGAVIVAHLMGRGQQDIAAIAGVCAEHGVPLLEDVAQSFGVSVAGRRAGTFGAAAWCSFNHHKLLATGDGGFVLVRDGAFFDRLCARHDQGHLLRDGKRRPAAVLEPGLSLRANELMAAVLRAQLARYHFIRARVQALHDTVSSVCCRVFGIGAIPPHDGDIPFTVLCPRPPGLRYPSLADSGWHVASNVAWLAAEWNEAADADAALAATGDVLAGTMAVGAGFVDPYYAVPEGLAISDSPGDAPRLTDALGRGVREHVT